MINIVLVEMWLLFSSFACDKLDSNTWRHQLVNYSTSSRFHLNFSYINYNFKTFSRID